MYKIQELYLYCHNCRQYVRFSIDTTDGNHILKCPNCGHEHCRVVLNGYIIGDGRTFRINPMAVSISSTSVSASYDNSNNWSSGTTGSTFLSQSWLNSTSNR